MKNKPKQIVEWLNSQPNTWAALHGKSKIVGCVRGRLFFFDLLTLSENNRLFRPITAAGGKPCVVNSLADAKLSWSLIAGKE